VNQRSSMLVVVIAERARYDIARRRRAVASWERIRRVSGLAWVLVHRRVGSSASGVLRSSQRFWYRIRHLVYWDQNRDSGDRGWCKWRCVGVDWRSRKWRRAEMASFRMSTRAFDVTPGIVRQIFGKGWFGRVRDTMWRGDANGLERAPRLSPAGRSDHRAIAGLIRCETGCREGRAKQRNEIVTDRPANSAIEEMSQIEIRIQINRWR
jgi:hypothetical protein